MGIRWQGLGLVLLVIVFCVAIAGGLIWNRSRLIPPLAGRMARLPAGSTVVYLDVSALRQSGLLGMIAGPQVTEDPVTGSFNASLAQWLTGEGLLPGQYIASQGLNIGRAGQVHVRRDAGGQVWVGGDSVTCVKGEVLL